ncbi:hypothetical protein SODALDRAFT_123972 [Sodiomyces alkalinus F11]|uniref:Uncharacterized protein n=1 Tax=Sodiomyces alkalinus (strain CBS 110278 / VKM F-3762 / F11) TaxID=1314773 RepID=A0A3N2Q4C6_SODAK|nr:hypothetical protein SODALDRAFT_123972 [Sodiomyces alkalinus F11]ROT41612.1 hypothetical protein SODALDRAFT_123972 [Sodiomyces alkalinus F11]
MKRCFLLLFFLRCQEHLFHADIHYAYLQALKEWVSARKDLNWADRTICSRLTRIFNNVDSSGKITIMSQSLTPDQVLTPAEPSQHWRWMERLDRQPKPRKDRKSKASAAASARGRSGRGAGAPSSTAHDVYGGYRRQHQGPFQGHHHRHHHQPQYQQKQYQPQFQQYQGSSHLQYEQQRQPPHLHRPSQNSHQQYPLQAQQLPQQQQPQQQQPHPYYHHP